MRSASEPPAASRADTAAAPLLTAMDLLGQRWMLRVLWELEPGPLGFLELRRRMGNCSSSMLSVRLQRLQNANLLVKQTDKSYELTTVGRELAAALEPVWAWSRRWADSIADGAGGPE